MTYIVNYSTTILGSFYTENMHCATSIKTREMCKIVSNKTKEILCTCMYTKVILKNIVFCADSIVLHVVRMLF